MTQTISFGFCKKVFLALVAGALFSSCSADGDSINKVDFDRKAMLTHWADNIILPAFATFDNEVNTLNDKVAAYKNGTADLNVLRSQFKTTYLAFQSVKPFEVGPSADISFRASLNTYPCDTDKVATNIGSANYNLVAASNLDARGFPTMDYLLFSKDIDFENNVEAKKYMEDLIADIKNLSSQVNRGWQLYRDNFINASGTDVGSSLGQVVNSINKDYEIVKNAKIGFPAGKKTLGTPYPHTCESYFGGFSIDLAEANIIAIHNLFLGINSDGSQNGPSLQDYLQALNAKHNSDPLDQVIDNQFRTALNTLKLVPNPFSESVVNHVDKVDSAYLEIQRNVVYLKTDMPSAMGVLITYQDNDGD